MCILYIYVIPVSTPLSSMFIVLLYIYIYSETSIWNHPASTDEVELRSSLHSLEGAQEQATQATLSFFGAICSTRNAGVIPCDLKT